MTMDSTERREFYRERFGAFYTPESASNLIGMSIHEIKARIKDNYILAPVTSDGEVVLPELQFINGRYNVSMALLLSSISNNNEGLDDWSKLFLITNPMDIFQGRNAVEVVSGGNASEFKELQQILSEFN